METTPCSQGLLTATRHWLVKTQQTLPFVFQSVTDGATIILYLVTCFLLEARRYVSPVSMIHFRTRPRGKKRLCDGLQSAGLRVPAGLKPTVTAAPADTALWWCLSV